MGYETILDALQIEGAVVARPSQGTQVRFKCPAHEDRVASGSLDESDGRALLYCHAGCDTESIVEALGLEMKDLFVGERNVQCYYEYVGPSGEPLYRVVRFEPKGFTQERYVVDTAMFVPGLGSTPRVLYNLPAVLKASRVYLVEGEKDADAITALGEVGTCNLGGAGKWQPEWSESLRGKDVIIVPDNDEPGEKHARAVQAALDGVARSVTVKYAAAGKDVSDHLAAGFSLSELTNEPSPEEAFDPLDWETYEAPGVQWLMEPYFPTRGRVLVYGKAGSLKSLWVMWVATRLAREGKKVAYFSLEMRPEQTVARLKKLRPPRENFRVFTKYELGNKDFMRRTIDALRGFDMIVVDSFNAAFRFSKGGTHDDQVAALDDEFFQPIIEGTGATLVLIDNTGHDIIAGFGTRIASQHPRGTSAKVDKVDVGIYLERPDENDNYLTEIHVKKMRYDLPIPTKRAVVAPSDHDGIEFFLVDAGGEAQENMWKQEDMIPDERRGTETGIQGMDEVHNRGFFPEDDDQAGNRDPLEGLSAKEKLAYVRAQKMFQELSEEQDQDSSEQQGEGQ